MKGKHFEKEADLCAAFIDWMKRKHPDVRVYSEWWNWDIFLVYPEGWQCGIQAKLRINAEVINQAVPSRWYGEHDERGPDFRAILVPDARGSLARLAGLLGLEVFHPRREYDYQRARHTNRWEFVAWPGDGLQRVDWCPTERLPLPPVETDSVAGSPCPVTLTPWKLAALDVLAELEVVGTVTTKRMRELGVNPSRWLSGRWLEPTEVRGIWKRGERCPTLEREHPTAWAAALAKAQQAKFVPLPTDVAI